MKLKLKRPLAFFDIESTGVNVASDKIVEISILKAMPDGTEQIKTLRINPEINIPLEASLVHGIYDEDVKDCPPFKKVAKDIALFIADADLAGYNSNKFDVPMLMEEFLRADIDFKMEGRKLVDVQNIFHQMEPRTLGAAYKFYCNKEIENAHSAEADIKATYDVLLAQLDKYENVEYKDKAGNISKPVQNDVEALSRFTLQKQTVDYAGRIVYDETGNEVFNFGKHKGKPLRNIFASEPSYYSWMMNGDFPLYTKKKLTDIWNKFTEEKLKNALKG